MRHLGAVEGLDLKFAGRISSQGSHFPVFADRGRFAESGKRKVATPSPTFTLGALDGKSAKVVVLLLMPADSPELLLEIYADIGTTFTHESTVAKLLQAKSYTEVLAVLRFAQTARVLW